MIPNAKFNSERARRPAEDVLQRNFHGVKYKAEKCNELTVQASEELRNCIKGACLQGDGGPQGSEVTRFNGVSRLSVSSLILICHLYMIGGVIRHMLPHPSGVPHLHVNRPVGFGM